MSTTQFQVRSFDPSRDHMFARRVHVTPLMPEVTETELGQMFEGMGLSVRGVKFVRKHDRPAYAFVTFRRSRDAQAAVDRAKTRRGIRIRNSRLLVNPAYKRDTVPEHHEPQDRGTQSRFNQPPPMPQRPGVASPMANVESPPPAMPYQALSYTAQYQVPLEPYSAVSPVQQPYGLFYAPQHTAVPMVLQPFHPQLYPVYPYDYSMGVYVGHEAPRFPTPVPEEAHMFPQESRMEH